MPQEKIQCIIISKDVYYKTKVQEFLNAYTDSEVILVNTLIDALAYLNERPPFKFLIRKPSKPLDKEEIENCSKVVQQGMNFRIVLFQKEYENLAMLLNLSSIRYMQEQELLFSNLKLKTVLKRLSGK